MLSHLILPASTLKVGDEIVGDIAAYAEENSPAGPTNAEGIAPSHRCMDAVMRLFRYHV